MKIDNIVEYIDNKEMLKDITISAIKDQIKDYHYCAPLYLLLAQKLIQLGKNESTHEMAAIAIHIPNRKKLQEILNKTNIESPDKVTQIIEKFLRENPKVRPAEKLKTMEKYLGSIGTKLAITK